MTNYLDSSVIMRYLLGQPDAFLLQKFGGEFISSELSVLECRRTLNRYRLIGEMDDKDLLRSLKTFQTFLREFNWSASLKAF